MRFNDQVIAITGASSGIGEATALAAAREGALVVLGARRAERIERLRDRIVADGGRAVALTTDVGDENQVRKFVQRSQAETGRLDALVNNAGVMLLAPVAAASTDDWRRMIDVNLFGVLYGTHAAVPLMLEQEGPIRGHIVNVSSTAGRIAGATSGVYCATKWGVGAFSEALHKEVARLGLRVTVIEPGLVETELVEHTPAPIQTYMRSLVDGELLAPEDIAESILYALAAPPRVSIGEILLRPARQA